MKRFITGALALITGLTMAFSPVTAFAAPSEPPITVYVHGERVIFPDQQPVIIDGHTLVPIRGVFDALGFRIEWFDESQSVQIYRQVLVETEWGEGFRDQSIYIIIGSQRFYASAGTGEFDLAIPAQIIGGRTMIPLRAPLEAMGYELEWVGETRTILITSPTPD